MLGDSTGINNYWSQGLRPLPGCINFVCHVLDKSM